jgi:hypothetical protein
MQGVAPATTCCEVTASIVSSARHYATGGIGRPGVG